PTTVEGEHAIMAGRRCDDRSTQCPGGRPGQHGGDRLFSDLLGRQHPSVGLHHVEGHAGRSGRLDKLRQPGRDVPDVPADARLDRGVDQRRHRSLVLAVLPQDLRRDRYRGVRVLAREYVTHAPLVLGVGEGVDETDTDGVDAAVTEEPGGGHRVVEVERPDLGAVGCQPPAHGTHQVGWNDAWWFGPEVAVAVTVRYRLPGNLQHVPE